MMMSGPQQPGMAPPQYSQGQPVIIMQAPAESPKLETYHGKAAVVLGIIQIILAVVMIGIWVGTSFLTHAIREDIDSLVKFSNLPELLISSLS